MIEAVLIIVIVYLGILIGVLQYSGIREREKLLKMLMARNLDEVTANEEREKIKPTPPIPQPEMVELDPNDDTTFDRHIKDQLRKNTVDDGSEDQY